MLNNLNWLENEKIVEKPIAITGREESIDLYLGTLFPVYNDMIQFGTDFHNFMDTNDLNGLSDFINKYINSDYRKAAQFANGLQMDIDAVRNTLLHPEISSGVVEGTNNLIKCVKRVGGSRMKIDFLCAKMVLRTSNKKSLPA